MFGKLFIPFFHIKEEIKLKFEIKRRSTAYDIRNKSKFWQVFLFSDKVIYFGFKSINQFCHNNKGTLIFGRVIECEIKIFSFNQFK